MKWERYILLLLDTSDPVLMQDANEWKRRYRIPDDLCFCLGKVANYRMLEPYRSLAVSDENTKIIVVAHGSRFSVNVQGESLRSAWLFAQRLKSWGLERAGLLAFKACSMGKGNYLEELACALQNRDIDVDWLTGYRDWATQLPAKSSEGIGSLDYGLRLLSRNKLKLPDFWRIKVVEGRYDASPRPGSKRYR
jgi:hypothetical protein